MRVLIVLVFLCSLFGSGAMAQSAPPEVKKRFDLPTLAGKATGRFWGIPIFYAQLWTNEGAKFQKNGTFALSLQYAYNFSAETLARTSVEEIARVEGNSPETHKSLESQLRKCLIDVDKGTRITGVATGANTAEMFINGRRNCTLNYPRVRTRFFGIWLAPTARDPKGAARLRGQG